jgi:hypothetical protein
MQTMAIYVFVYDRQIWIFGDNMCDLWQLIDVIFSTISLYSTLAIGLDRWWNIEQPLRIFKRSRRIAKRLIVVIWLLPFVVWLPTYALFTDRPASSALCYTSWRSSYIVPALAIPFLYLPSAVLVAMFCRIALVVQKHLRFLRAHSNQQYPGGGTTNSSNSLVGANGHKSSRETTPLRSTPDVLRKTDTSGMIEC